MVPSTWQAYHKMWDTYRLFSEEVLLKSPQLPLSPMEMVYFVAHLCHKRLAPSTITGHVSAISMVHKMNELPDPANSALLQRTLQGVRRNAPQSDTRLPITQDLLTLMWQTAPMALADRYDVLLMRALILVAFRGFFRLGELVQRRGVQVVQLSGLQYTEQGMSLTLPSSKTTPSPVTVGVRRMPFVCPVAAVQEFVEARGPSPGPLFAHADGSAFSHARVQVLLNVIFTACGMDPRRYKGHSFRIGAASEAARAGYSDAQIRLMGRWKSDAFRKYIRIAQWVRGLGVGRCQVTARVAGPQTQ